MYSAKIQKKGKRRYVSIKKASDRLKSTGCFLFDKNYDAVIVILYNYQMFSILRRLHCAEERIYQWDVIRGF